MGFGYALRCSNCLHQLDLLLGVGRRYFSLENVVDQLHPTRRARVLDILKNHKVGKTYYWMAIYQCEKCRRLYNRLYSRIEFDDDQVYETIYKCPKCRLPLKEVKDDFDLTKAPCPSCGELCLEPWGHINWD